MTLKVGAEHSQRWTVFEVDIQPGFDVGAHVHTEAEELFYVLDGELDLLAFEPRIRTTSNWQNWESVNNTGVQRAGPGYLTYVPAGCPHAFANPTDRPARMLLHVAPPGHEVYLEKLVQLLGSESPPDQAAITRLRAEFDIEQLTPLIPGTPVQKT